MRRLTWPVAFLLAGSVFAQSGIIVKPKKINSLVYAAAYATSGSGTSADPFVTSGSNPIQAAITACPSTGCTIELDDYYYSLGTTFPAITIPKTTSSTDKRFYKIVGKGAVLNCPITTGTDVCIKYWQDNNGTPGQSIQSNFGNELGGFSLRNSGTARTGTGIWFNYSTHWYLHDLEIGTRKGERAAGDNGFTYGIKFAERTGSYQTVDDFNTIEHCRFSGNTHAFFAGQQADNLRLLKNFFEANPNVSAAQDGAEIAGSNAITVQGNTFNLYGFNANMFGLKLSGDMSGAQIQGNYFEGDAKGVFLNATLDQDGIDISGNMFSLNSIVGSSGASYFGVDAGINGSFHIRGLRIAANEFTSIGDYEYGVRLGSDVGGACHLGPNYYTLVGGSLDFNTVLIPGASGAGVQCVIEEAAPGSSSVLEPPQVRVEHAVADFPAFIAENMSSTAGDSPIIQWISGGGSHLYFNSYVDTVGLFHLTNGSDRLTVSAAGVVTPGSNFSGPLTGNVTGDVTGSVTAGAGKSVVATAGTVRIPNSTSLPGTCTVGDEYMDTDATTGQQFYLCTATNTWTLQGDGGGSVAFSALGGGTNTTAGSMIVGNGVTLSYTGTGSIAAKTADNVTQNITFAAANVTGTVAADHGGTGVTTYAAGDITYAGSASPTVLSRLAKDTNVNRYLANTGASNVPKWDTIDLGVAGSFTNALLATKGGTGLTSGTSGGVNYWSSTTTQASSGLLAVNGIVYGGGAGAAPATSAATVTSGGSIAIPTTQTLDVAAHATDGGSLVLKEGADDGSNTFTLKVPNSGLSSDKVATLTANGNLPAGAIESAGTNTKCAMFDASGILTADVGACGASAGDITAVGAGCATGACFTNGLATVGTELLRWEGTTVDANDFFITVPADPTGATSLVVPNLANVTFPAATDTLVGKATTDTLTNKTLDAEGTGNLLTTVEKLWLPAAGCNNATAASFWDLPSSNAPTPTCASGSNTQKAYLVFPDSDGAYSAQQTLMLPSDWVGTVGTVDVRIKWLSAITTGNVFWQVSTICVADAETDDPAFNPASTIADTAKGTTLQTNDASITGLTMTGCAAGELLHLKIMRDRTDASDTLGASSAQLIGVELTLRRAQ